MKHTADFTVATTRHPTPAQIRREIMDRLMDDYEQNPADGAAPFIPVRTIRLVNEAITAACEKYGSYQ